LVDDQALGRKEPNMMIIGVDYHPGFQEIVITVCLAAAAWLSAKPI
jgi:hypothetical protein